MNTFSETENLPAKVEALQTALAHGESRMNEFELARAREDLATVDQRLRLGVDHTVVALVGGTGSGKSTLFNALTDLDFADSGEIRPTTERATACTWGDDATEILDFLGVDEDRRIRRGSILTDEEPEFEGMVLLDLPDHDSVRVQHSVQVSTLVPLVDLLIWVVDPQKYADQALHRGYLADLRERKESMLVVLNQIDTVPFGQRSKIASDVEAVLAKDGLDGVPVVTTSALNHEGIDELRIHLAAAVSKDSINARTAAAELAAIARRLEKSVGETEVEVTDELLEPATSRLASISGVGAVSESIRASGESWRPRALAKPEQPANSSVLAVRDSLIDKLSDGLPLPWKDDVKVAVSEPERLRRAVGEAVSKVAVPTPSSRNALVLVGLGALLVIAGLVYGGLILAGVLDGTLTRWLIAAIVTFAGVWSFSSALTARKRSAISAADRYEQRSSDAILEVLKKHVGAPASEVLREHQATREALSSVTSTHS